tara:strand:+ start:895 stop:1557 length:663 start_codon:yes stop_codon:yes gene_type:complete
MNNSDYVFKEHGDKLEFIGDFDSLYKNESDPWNQSGGSDVKYSEYYTYSRERLNNKLKEINPNSLLEVGCGLGYTTQIIQGSLPKCYTVGMDISSVAVTKADKLFSNLKFISGDISSIDFSSDVKYDVVILNQLLWYILESLSDSFENCFSILNPNGKVIVSQAFLQSSQKYGANICDGFDGLISYLNENMNHIFKIEYSNLDESNSFVHNDGLIILTGL